MIMSAGRQPPFRPVRDDQQNSRLLKPPDDPFQQLLTGRVDPVGVLEQEQNRVAFRQP